MSRLDISARVYGDSAIMPATCMWFAACINPANGLRRGPIGGGNFGDIPICQRCDDKIETL